MTVPYTPEMPETCESAKQLRKFLRFMRFMRILYLVRDAMKASEMVRRLALDVAAGRVGGPVVASGYSFETINAAIWGGYVIYDGRMSLTSKGAKLNADTEAKRVARNAKARARGRAMAAVMSSIGMVRTKYGWE